MKNDGWKITFLLGWLIFSSYVKLPGSTPLVITSSKTLPERGGNESQ